MDVRFNVFVEYIEDKKLEMKNSIILYEKQAIQTVKTLENYPNVNVAYNFVFQEECIDTIQLIAFFAPIKIRKISGELLWVLNELNRETLSLYLLHKGENQAYLRVIHEIVTMCGNKERNERILDEYFRFQCELDENYSKLVNLLI